MNNFQKGAESSPLSRYYKSIELSPVEHDIRQEELWRLHEKKRRNLLELNLKLPVRLWNGAEVLEFGPGSGENAAILATYGAKLTLVEPLGYLIDKLRDKFAQRDLSDSIRSLHEDTIENFQTRKEYDVVLAEGFIHFLEDPEAAIRKMTSCVSENGFLVLGIVHTAGTFIEFLKKLLLASMIRVAGAKTAEEQMACAKALFFADFEGINHSRGFESWVRDTVLNPLYRRHSMLDLEEVLRGVPDDFYLYSSWPNYLNMDDLVWHKTIKDNKRMRKEALDGYYARYPHFLHSHPTGQSELELCSPEAGRKIAKAMEGCLRLMDRGVDLKNKNFSLSKMAKEFSRLQKNLSRLPQLKKSALLLKECAVLFKSLEKAKSGDDFPKAYRKVKFLKQCWGSPGHYYVFARNK